MENLKNLIGKKIVDGVVELSDSSISKDSIKNMAVDNGYREVRIYKKNDFISQDYNTKRLNILVTEAETIKDISAG
jgi:hypothetical protein